MLVRMLDREPGGPGEVIGYEPAPAESSRGKSLAVGSRGASVWWLSPTTMKSCAPRFSRGRRLPATQAVAILDEAVHPADVGLAIGGHRAGRLSRNRSRTSGDRDSRFSLVNH